MVNDTDLQYIVYWKVINYQIQVGQNVEQVHEIQMNKYTDKILQNLLLRYGK